MSIWCYSRWERLWGSGQIRKRGGSSRCWSRMMYCCSLWDSDNTSTKVEQGNGEKNWSLLIQTGLETRHASEHLKMTNMILGPAPSPLCDCQILLLKHHPRFDLFYISLSLEALHTTSLSFASSQAETGKECIWTLSSATHTSELAQAGHIQQL